MQNDNIEVFGAKEHNLKGIDVKIPRHSFTVITGLSGSGKSSLAFDTIFAEGQRRYIETFNSYARTFLPRGLERPDVDEIRGLGPVISIEQKTTNKNPRSTVGTITEIYDFIRLLYAKAADAYSYLSGEKMKKFGDDTIVDMVMESYQNKRIYILSPVVKHRKGHYQDLFEKLSKRGYLSVRIDGTIQEIVYNMKLNRYQIHDIEIVVDKLTVSNTIKKRVSDSIKQAMKEGDNVMMILDVDSKKIKYYSRNLMDVESGLSYNEPAPNNFSFNSPIGQCPHCLGLGQLRLLDREKIFPDKNISIYDGGISIYPKTLISKNKELLSEIDSICKEFGSTMKTPIKDLSEELISTLLYGHDNESIYSSKIKIFSSIQNHISSIMEYTDDRLIQEEYKSFFKYEVCKECNGQRLNKEALSYFIDRKNIGDINSMELTKLNEWLENIEDKLTDAQKKIANEILKEIRTRVKFLLDVGLGYLSLNRPAASLSGGESQRIRLATQIGTQLVEVVYILDEPSIGLHQRDNIKLINSLKKLRDIGNTIIVVEHDKDMIISADHIIDIGPKAGKHGGLVVFEGSSKELEHTDTITSQYINGTKCIPTPSIRRKGSGKYITIKNASGNNLKNIDVCIPLGMLVGITGVSGSGKSTLINQTLYPAISKNLYNSLEEPLAYESIEGIENIDKIISVDQQPIGRTPRSNPATYTGVFTDIRNLFANLQESKMRGYKPGRFSFNVKSGRCETCSGNGYKKIEMNFLPDVYVPCEVCQGKRYNRETLEIRYKGKNIANILNMTINKAVDFFENIPQIQRKIKVLQEVGLGYLTLGQSSTTLSGGESQRIKLAGELSKKDTGRTLYVLDEPTTGLHFEDIKVLMGILNKLVDRGNSIIVIEHNLDVIKGCDYLLEIGPEGGNNGGKLIFAGTPETLSNDINSPTGIFIKQELLNSK